MKHNELRAIAHNIADSLASGYSVLSGFYGSDIFGEAARSSEGCITVDFLRGTVTQGTASDFLLKSIGGCKDALPRFCEKHGATVSDFREVTAHYNARGRLLTLTIEDSRGHRSTMEYAGIPARRIKVLDALGRIRRTGR